MSTVVRRRPPRAATECELARGVREPIAKNLLGGKSAFLEPRSNRLGRLAVLLEIRGGEFRGHVEFLRYDAVDLTTKTGTIMQYVLELRPAIADRHGPSNPRVKRGRDFKLKQVAQDAPDLGPELTPV